MIWVLLLGFVLSAPASPSGCMTEVGGWPGVDLQFPSIAARNAALADGKYAPNNMTVWSTLVYRNRMFLFCPNQFEGTYSTVNFVYINELSTSGPPPTMRPYLPTFTNNITSVFSAALSCQDRCMYLVDDGVRAFYSGGARVRVHPPRLFRVHLPSDCLELLYTLPPSDYTDTSTFTALVVDQCCHGSGVHVVYICDLAQFAMVVVDLKKNESFRVKHPYFVMDPFSAFLVTAAGDRHTFLADGLAALALSEPHPCSCDRTLYFTCSGGRNMFSVSTGTLRHRNSSQDTGEYWNLGYKGDYSQSNNMVYDPNSKVLFYATFQDNSLYCWNTREYYLGPWSQRVVMRNDTHFRTPNALQADCDGNLWALANNWIGALRRGATSGATGSYDITVWKGSIRECAAVCSAW